MDPIILLTIMGACIILSILLLYAFDDIRFHYFTGKKLIKFMQIKQLADLNRMSIHELEQSSEVDLKKEIFSGERVTHISLTRREVIALANTLRMSEHEFLQHVK